MPRANHIQTNVTAGEISPLVYGRVDTSKYQNAAARVENFIVKPHGPLWMRHGTKYLGEVKDSSNKTILHPFMFSTEQAYILEFGHQYIRIYKDEELLEDGGVPVEIATPYDSDDLENLYFAQSADVLFITHTAYPPKTLSRLTPTTWVLADYDPEDGPYMDKDDDAATLWLSSVLYRATIKSTANDFASGDVGKFVEYIDDGFPVVGEIKTFVSAKEVTVEPRDNVVATSSIDPRAIVDYAAADGPFPNRLRATTAIWGVEAENAYIKVGGSWYLTASHLPMPEESPEEKVSKTSGSLIVGKYYRIVNNSGSADWTNVGAPNNDQDTVFKATGTTPTSWGTGELVPYPRAMAFSFDVIEVVSTLTMVSTSGNLSVSNKKITATMHASEDTFDSGRDVGRKFRLKFANEQVWGHVTSVTSATEAEVELGRSIPIDPKQPNKYLSEAKTKDWRWGAWYVGNYPRCVTIHDQRLVFAGTPAEPQTVWMSMSAEYFSMRPTEPDSAVLDNNAITVTIGSSTVNSIVWLQSSAVLLIGTIGGEWQISASNLKDPLTPSDVTALPQTSRGSREGGGTIVRAHSAILFIQRAGTKLLELKYSYEVDRYITRDLTILSEHILRDTEYAKTVVFQQEPNNLLWIVTNSGQLVCCTFEPDQEVIAWSRHQIGGDGIVESAAVIPSMSGNEDDLYLIVKRTINGSTKRYIEKLTKDFHPQNAQDKDDMVFLDSYVTGTSPGALYAVDVSHLIGETVTIVADGSVRPPQTIESDGLARVAEGAKVIHVGLPYQALIKTLPVEAGSAFGTAQGKVKRVYKVAIRVNNSIGMSLGVDEDNLDLVSFRSSSGLMDQSPDFFTGDKIFPLDSKWETDGSFFIAQTQPYPLNIVAWMPIVKTNE